MVFYGMAVAVELLTSGRIPFGFVTSKDCPGGAELAWRRFPLRVIMPPFGWQLAGKRCKGAIMVRPMLWRWLLCITAVLASSASWAADETGQSLLDKATETKLSAENVADLNDVIKLCESAIQAGLDDGNRKFANELLASTLAQRAEFFCLELFERPVTPRRGRILVQMALGDLERTLEINPEQAQAQYLIGRLYAHLGEREKALNALDKAVSLTEFEPAARSKALVLRANLKKDPAERLADYDQAVKLSPHDVDVLRFRGMFHLTQNHFEPAIADLDAAIALDPKDADTYEARGIAQSLAQKYDEAMESFNKAIELEPDSPAAYTHRARVRAIKGDAPAALHDVEQALKLQPGSVQALQLHAMLLGSAGKFEQALADLNVLRQAMPDNTEILLQIALLYQADKQPQKAAATYSDVLLADANNVSALRGRADSFLNQGKQAEAIHDYEDALKSEPKDSGVLNNLAWVLATSPEDELRNGKRAIELAKLACEVTEYKQAHILSTLAASYAETGDFETAITWSEKAVELGAEALKGQLAKELESYQSQKPWREAIPPSDLAPESSDPEKTAAPEDTARQAKRGS
jgi:tetratricopeptide (TPR) repeat protein